MSVHSSWWIYFFNLLYFYKYFFIISENTFPCLFCENITEKLTCWFWSLLSRPVPASAGGTLGSYRAEFGLKALRLPLGSCGSGAMPSEARSTSPHSLTRLDPGAGWYNQTDHLCTVIVEANIIIQILHQYSISFGVWSFLEILSFTNRKVRVLGSGVWTLYFIKESIFTKKQNLLYKKRKWMCKKF